MTTGANIAPWLTLLRPYHSHFGSMSEMEIFAKNSPSGLISAHARPIDDPEKAGLRTGCGVRSQVIDVLKAQIKKGTSNERRLLEGRWCPLTVILTIICVRLSPPPPSGAIR